MKPWLKPAEFCHPEVWLSWTSTSRVDSLGTDFIAYELEFKNELHKEENLYLSSAFHALQYSVCVSSAECPAVTVMGVCFAHWCALFSVILLLFFLFFSFSSSFSSSFFPPTLSLLRPVSLHSPVLLPFPPFLVTLFHVNSSTFINFNSIINMYTVTVTNAHHQYKILIISEIVYSVGIIW